VDLPLPAVGLRHRRVDDLDHHRRDVEPGAVALDVGDDWVVGDVEAVVLVDGDLRTARGDLDVLVAGHGISWWNAGPEGSGSAAPGAVPE
jgi:hypothetical protein